MQLTHEQWEWYSRVHQQWFSVMKPFTAGFHINERLFPPLPQLSAERLAGCVLLPSREDLLRRLPKRSIGAEIGTQEGFFAAKIMEIVEPEELHLFDLYYEPFARAHQSLATHHAIQFHVGDSSTNLAAGPSNFYDWIYIDGAHDFAGVKRDIEIAQTRVKPGGLLCFNDFALWSPAECCAYGVPYAVCEFANEQGWDVVYFALHPHGYNDIALRRPGES